MLFLVHRKELVEQIIQTFYNWGVDLALCRVMMVQTACRRIKRLKPPRLIITDENHHCLASSYRKIYDAFPNAQCLGVTATPIRLNGGGLGDVNDRLVLGVSAKWLIANQYLAPYEYYAPTAENLSGIHIRRGEFDAGESEARMNTAKICGDVIMHYNRLAAGKKAICYCITIAHSREMAQRFCAAGIPAAHIDGSTDKCTRNKIIAQFRAGTIRILCNVDLISEGFDVPDCACSILLRPTQSLTLFIQQSMRAMRYQPNKIATIIDHVGNYSRFGLPDDDREWSLDAKKEKKKMVSDEHKVRQCPACFFTFSNNPTCPKCGYTLPKIVRAIDENKNGNLELVHGFTVDTKTIEDCHTYADLISYAQTHGYKRGWAYYQAKQRGILA